MDITAREDRFQQQWQAFQAGELDGAAFQAAVDALGFRDAWGLTWRLNPQTGQWRYYDGRQWRQADPQRADRLPFFDSKQRAWQYREEGWAYYQPRSKSWIQAKRQGVLPAPFSTPTPWSQRLALVFGSFCVMLLILLVMPVQSGPPVAPPLIPPRPPLDQPSDGDDGGDGGGPWGSIQGQLIDLTTGQPGAGIAISVNGQIVRTDADGSYSITGLRPGDYVVSPELGGQGVLAQRPVHVVLNGPDNAIVDLRYYSGPLPPPTDTPQAVAAAQASPASLPPSGASLVHLPWLFLAAGLLLLAAGGKMATSST